MKTLSCALLCLSLPSFGHARLSPETSTHRTTARGTRTVAEAAPAVPRRARVAPSRTRGHATDGRWVLIEPVLPLGSTPDGRQRFFEVRFAADGLEGVPDFELPGTTGPRGAEVCRDDRFFFHFTDFHYPEALLPADEAALAVNLDTIAARMEDAAQPQWFRAAEAGSEHLRVQRAQRGQALAALRTAIAQGLPGQDVSKVQSGRVCTFAPQAEEAPPKHSETMKRWHLERVQALSAPRSRTRVNVALLDGGIHPELVAGEERPVSRAFDDDFGAPVRHGDHMALLIRQLAPQSQVALNSYRVFPEVGHATTHELAQALSSALFDPQVSADEPLLINLSLGWAPELSMDRSLVTGIDGEPLSEPQVEHPVGGAVRHLLDHAWKLDQSGERRVSVLAATGNRPGRLERNLAAATEYFGTDGTYDDPCMGKFELGDAFFFPAEWGFQPTCELGETGLTQNKRAVVIPVGGIDARDQRAAMDHTTKAGPAAIVAPAEHVFADWVAGVSSGTSPLTLPAKISGTSAAAAITTGVAAQLHIMAAVEGHSLDTSALQRLLWQSGSSLSESLSGRTMSFVEARVPSLCRAQIMLGCTQTCPDPSQDLLACLQAGPPSDLSPIQPGLAAQCAHCYQECMERLDACEGEVEVPAALQAHAKWVQEYEPEPPALGAPMQVCQEGSEDCQFELMDGEPLVDGYALGRVDPQPGEDGCNECDLFDFGGSFVDADLHVTLNPKLGSAAQFVKSWLVIRDQDKKWHYVNLANEGANLSSWTAGKKVSVTYIQPGSLGSTNVDWNKATADFVVNVVGAASGASLSEKWSVLTVPGYATK